MIVIRRNPVNRLGELIRKPGGILVADALHAAQQNLKSVEAECLLAMDEKLAEIAALVSQCRSDPTDEDLHTLYGLGNDVLEVAGVFELNPLSEAAFSLCDLIDRFKTHQRFSYPALVVHLQALQALRAMSGPPDPSTAVMIDGLRRVVGTIGPQT